MQTQLTQLTIDDALAQAEIAITRVMQNAGEPWLDYAIRLIKAVAFAKKRFTSDTVMNCMNFKPHDSRALGSAMKLACRLKIIRATGEFQPSTRRHGTPIRVWEYSGVKL